MRRTEGRVVRPLDWKMNLCKKRGIRRAKRTARARPTGEGLRAACAKSCMVTIALRVPYK
jgi:hypothetical protein